MQGCFAGTAACLPFAGQLLSQLGSAPVSDTLNVVYLGLFPTMLGFTTWAYALTLHGRQPNALKPGIHGVRTRWIRGFMAFGG